MFKKEIYWNVSKVWVTLKMVIACSSRSVKHLEDWLYHDRIQEASPSDHFCLQTEELSNFTRQEVCIWGSDFFNKSILSLSPRCSLFKINVFECYNYCKKNDDDYISLLTKMGLIELKSVTLNLNVLKDHWYLNSLNTEVDKCLFYLKIWNVHFTFIIVGLLKRNIVFFYPKIKR